MTLYDAIKNKYGGGLNSGARYSKQKELYQKLGSPLGPYTGSAAQNIWLLNNKDKWDTAGQPAPAPAPVSPPSQIGIDNPVVKAIIEGADPTKVGFNKILDREKYVNNPLFDQQARERVMPGIIRDQYDATQNLGVQQGMTGGWRGGMANEQQFDLSNQFGREASNQVASWVDSQKKLAGDRWQDYYNEYVKDPNSAKYKDPDFMANLTNLYN